MLLLPSASRLLPQIRPCPARLPAVPAVPADPHSPATPRLLRGTGQKGNHDELATH